MDANNGDPDLLDESPDVLGETLEEIAAEEAPTKKKRKKTKLPGARTLELLRKQGAICQVVERWQKSFNPKPGMPPGVRIDLFGCIDIIALRDGRIWGIQATSYSNHSEHVKKALAEPRLIEWLKAGGRYEIWSWKKRKIRGQNKEVWEPRIAEIELPAGELSLIATHIITEETKPADPELF